MNARTQVHVLGLVAGLWMGMGCGPDASQLAPVFAEHFQSATETRGGGSVTVRVKAEDPRGGALSFSWEAQDGSLSTPVSDSHGSEVTWTAPACARVESLPTLIATATNTQGLSTSFTFTLKEVPFCTPSSFKAVSAGEYHTLAVDEQGRVWSWGYNASGQLGDGTTAVRRTPVVVRGLEGVVAVEAGAHHSLALKGDGTVWAWGYNGTGQLGDGTTTHRLTPGRVPGLSGAVALSAGYDHTLALKADGTVWASGYNWHGQVGDGTPTLIHSTPVQVVGLSGVVAVAAGYSRSMAVKADGTVWGWGRNSPAYITEPRGDDHRTPVRVAGLEQVVAAALGTGHTLVLKRDGTVWSWGSNLYGQLGQGAASGPEQWTPTQVPGVSGVVAIAAWDQASLALKSDGTVVSWGKNGLSLPGDNDPFIARKSPMLVPGLEQVVALSAGAGHWVGLRADGTLWGWGLNGVFGQLGTGTTFHRPTPVPASGLGEVVSLAVGPSHSVALKRDGTVWSWGSNDWGMLGDGTRVSRATPVRVPGLDQVVAVSAGYAQTLAVKADGTVWAWGDDRYTRISDGPAPLPHLTPVQVAGLSGVVAVSTTVYHALALKADGTVWAWGHNEFGQLGDGTTTDRRTPLAVPGLTGVVAVATGAYHSLALKADGTVWRWGYTQGPEGPNGWTYTQNETPEQVAGLTGVVAIAAAANYSLALKSDGTLWGWGQNNEGQLGDRSVTLRMTPVQVQRLDNVVSMSAGLMHAAAVKADGTLWVWGSNDEGQLGDAAANHVLVPVQMPDFSGARAVAAGRWHSGVLKADGTVWSWGASYSGEIGDGSSSFSVTPVQVGVRREEAGG